MLAAQQHYLSMNDTNQARTIALGIVGAAVGGVAGYFLFYWILRQGFYAILVPPVFLGLGAALLARRRSLILACICGVAGLGLAIFTEWSAAPFVADPSLGYFLTHLQDLPPVKLVMYLLGAIVSFRLGLGFGAKPSQPS